MPLALNVILLILQEEPEIAALVKQLLSAGQSQPTAEQLASLDIAIAARKSAERDL